VLVSELPFDPWVGDFEFIANPGQPYDVVCVAARQLRTGRTVELWRDEMGDRPPYDIGPNSIFIAFAANAELGAHAALNWPFPVHVLDLHTEFAALTNGRMLAGNNTGRSLIAALQAYGIATIGTVVKDSMRQRIMEGWPFSETEKPAIQEYCRSDIDALELLLPNILQASGFDLSRALLRGEFVKASSAMQARGVPIDTDIWDQLSDPAVWNALRTAAIPAVDAAFGVYEHGSFRLHLFEAYLERAGISWPRLESGEVDLRRDTFREMARAHPQVAPLYELRHHVSDLRRLKLAVGADRRNRTVLGPFSSKTSRSQPRAGEYIFGPSCWLRSLIKPGPGMAVAYIDLSSAEFGIAAALSGDERMLGIYRSGDAYLGCAKLFGVAPPDATKATHSAVRDAFKVVLLATQYGIGYIALATRLGINPIAAAELLALHRWHFPRYWAWSDGWVERACTTGKMQSAFGWTMHLEQPLSERTLRNWPIQTSGADILRLACILAERRGIRVLCPVHDAVLIEAPIGEIETESARMQNCLRSASRLVLDPDGNLGGFALRTDSKIVRYPDRYSDPRGDRMWNVVIGLLREIRLGERKIA
jgi:DNA polymerase I